MTRYKTVAEDDIFSKPSSKVALEDYEVVDIYNVFVARESWGTPADLLLAHPNYPVMLKGLVVVGAKTLELKFDVMTGFSVEDGDQGLHGCCKLFALGNRRWYRLRSAATAYQEFFDIMLRASRIYWILRDRRGDWLNIIDSEMSVRFPKLKEDKHPQKYLELARAVGVEYEAIDQKDFSDYWTSVASYLQPDSPATCEAGLALAMRHLEYIFHHMLVDRELMWDQSWVFKKLGLMKPRVQRKVMRRHSLVSPSVPSPNTDQIHQSLASPSLASPSLASPSLASPSLASPSLASPNSPAIKNEFLNTTRPFAEVSDSEPEFQQGPTSWRKRKRESESLELDAITQGLDNKYNQKSPDIQPSDDSSNSRSYLSKELKLTEDASRSSSRASRGTPFPGSPLSISDHNLSADGARNVTSKICSERASRHKEPFAAIAGVRPKQLRILTEILMDLLYEEGVLDLNVHDLIYVLERDWAVDTAKAISIIIAFDKPLLECLSATDSRAIEDRPESRASEEVNEANIWHATTLYDQLHKIHRIHGQDSDLLDYIDWQHQQIFHNLDVVEGYWIGREHSMQPAGPSRQARRLYNSGKGIRISSETSSVDSQAGASVQSGDPTQNHSATKGRPALRPARKKGTSMYIRNGAGPKVKRESIEIPSNNRKSTLSMTEPPDMTDENSRTKSYHEDKAMDDSNSDLLSITDSLTITRNYSETVTHWIPASFNRQAPRPFKVRRQFSTHGNNAGIWRCEVPRCYHFLDDAGSIDTKLEIVNHYRAHADEMLERVEMINEATAGTGISTSAITKKLAKEAARYRVTMNRDASL